MNIQNVPSATKRIPKNRPPRTTSNLQPFIKVPISIICEHPRETCCKEEERVKRSTPQRRLKWNLRQMSSAYAVNLAFTRVGGVNIV